jgi:hypothetical protein
VKDYISAYNLEAYKTINSKFFTKVQFSQYLLDKSLIEDLETKYDMFSVDMNKCRRNILLNYGEQFPVYSCLDNIKSFDGIISEGFYYVETENVFPMRKNGFYSKPMLEFCLQEGIITKENIKYQYKSSLTIEPNYFQPFVNNLMQIFEEKDLQKLSVNALVGMFGRRDNSFIDAQVCVKNDENDLGSIYSTYQRPFINDINDDYCVVTSKINIDKLENAYPIYAQILDCEAIESYKMTKLLESQNYIPICVKTDAVVYFGNSPLNISNYFWDKKKTILKYKNENPQLLKKSIFYSIEEQFKLESKQYNVIYDTNENNFNIDIAKKIVESNKGCFLDGVAGTGKTKLINEIITLINDNGSIKRLTPTNVSALLINGETIDKFAHSYLNGSKSLKKFQSIKYIFIDEVSMMRELFYSIFLTIKFHSPHIKFIISGDFNQLEPVNDRSFFNYQESHALHELVDGNKVLLTKCRRSDDKLFNLCQAILTDKYHDVTELINKEWNSYKNISFTNRKRKAVNDVCMKRFLLNKKVTFNVEKLEYDKNTQDYVLCEDMPLISRVNMKSLDVLNNEMFKCSKILPDEIIVTNEFKTLTIPKSKFNKIFLMAFCITTHKSQGLSLNEKYCIHEYSKFDNKLKYVALSRATNFNNINIIL